MKIISGNSNLPLAESVATLLGEELIYPQWQVFPDSERTVTLDHPLKDQDVYVIQSLHSPLPTHLMDLLLLLESIKRENPRSLTGIIPYLAYARHPLPPSTSSPFLLMGKLMATAGAQHLLTVDLHQEGLLERLPLPAAQLSFPLLFQESMAQFLKETNPLTCVLVSPDEGGEKRAQHMAKLLKIPSISLRKKRSKEEVEIEVPYSLEEIRGKNCIIVDDIIDSGRTLCHASTALARRGAATIRAYITHGVFSPGSLERISSAPLNNLIISDTIQATDKIKNVEKIRQLSISPFLASEIQRIHKDWREVKELISV
jgi:ribose-phosphate pyrophosphokinase